jgi:hypothetical protein
VLLTSSSATNAFYANAAKKAKSSGIAVYSLKETTVSSLPNTVNVYILIAPSTRSDYQAAEVLASSSSSGKNAAVIIVNGFAKVRCVGCAEIQDKHTHIDMLLSFFFLTPHIGVHLSSFSHTHQDPNSVSNRATMGYFLKPLTYNSQVAGYLIRQYPGPWVTLDAATKKVLGTWSDSEILVQESNTPDLRPAGRLVQKSVDERAIQGRRR